MLAILIIHEINVSFIYNNYYATHNYEQSSNHKLRQNDTGHLV